MVFLLGIVFSLVALVSWGVGDFLIQRSARVFGSWKVAFFIGIFGFVVLTPFVLDDLERVTARGAALLLLVGVVSIVSAALNFEALRLGKMAVIQPIIGLEVPIVVALGFFVAGERLSSLQLALIGLVFVGIVGLAATGRRRAGRLLERGALLGFLGALGLASLTFLVGYASRTDTPMLVIWSSHGVVALFLAAVLAAQGELGGLWADVRRRPTMLFSLCVLDNLAWLAFGYAAVLIPIAIATTVSENFITLSVILGVVVNRERLRKRQWFGAAAAIAGVVLLAAVSGQAL